jgi:hypothetical protein
VVILEGDFLFLLEVLVFAYSSCWLACFSSCSGWFSGCGSVSASFLPLLFVLLLDHQFL